MANKYYVITGNPQITQKNRNRFFVKKYQDDLYVIEDNEHSQKWLQGKTATEKTLSEANAIITARNEADTARYNETVSVEEFLNPAPHVISIPPLELQDLITEE